MTVIGGDGVFTHDEDAPMEWYLSRLYELAAVGEVGYVFFCEDADGDPAVALSVMSFLPGWGADDLRTRDYVTGALATSQHVEERSGSKLLVYVGGDGSDERGCELADPRAADYDG